MFDDIKTTVEKAQERQEIPKVRTKGAVPDIILHQRTLNEPANNAIVVEVKPHWGADTATLFDLVKLSTFTSNKEVPFPTYQRGMFLSFSSDGSIEENESWLFKLDVPEPSQF
ncbi:MAG: hypothetical protein K2X77_16700 [Candidatus Obscuribacterales bacterium]|jgi:hypothetical protein|nr:hypothetical protein [Candidatus Obscuribacterales bacterium]